MKKKSNIYLFAFWTSVIIDACCTFILSINPYIALVWCIVWSIIALIFHYNHVKYQYLAFKESLEKDVKYFSSNLEN